MKNFLSKKILIYFTIFIISLIFISLNIIKKTSYKNINSVQEKPMEIEKITINRGDIFSLTLNKTKLSQKDIDNITKELKKIININYCVPGDFYEISYDNKTGEWINFFYYPSGHLYYSITKSSDNTIKSEIKKLEITKNKYKKEGTISSTLWTAMVSQNIPANIIGSFMDIFAWQIDFLTDTKSGDTFKVVYKIRNINKTNKQLMVRIIAAQYKTRFKTYNAFYFKTQNGSSGYFDEKGKSVKSAFLKAPLQFTRISSHFTTRRFHPILKYARPHLGIDYAAPVGTPVSAIGDGTIMEANYSGDFGKLVIIKHSNGYETYYGHLSKYGKRIKKGVKVKQGQIIGYVGMTGLATGPHLDFRIKLNGKFFDYLKMKQHPNTTLTGEDKINFKRKIQSYLEEQTII